MLGVREDASVEEIRRASGRSDPHRLRHHKHILESLMQKIVNDRRWVTI